MRDGRPNTDIWGNILTCGEIAMGIYQIIGTKKQGIQMPKEIAEEILPESAITQAEPDGDDLCFTDPLTAALVADELIKQELVTDPEIISRLDCLRQLNEPEYDTAFEPAGETAFELGGD